MHTHLSIFSLGRGSRDSHPTGAEPTRQRPPLCQTTGFARHSRATLPAARSRATGCGRLSRHAVLAPALVWLAIASTAWGSPQWLEFPPADQSSDAPRIVLLSGDEEYRSEEALPMLAAILSQRHGFHCTVLFPIDPATGAINPNNQESLPGSEALDEADLIVMALRFRRYPDAIAARFQAAVDRGTPIVGLRTSTHAFRFPNDSPHASLNDFGKRVLGEQWVSHWGRHKAEATRGVIEPTNASHPILKGVSDVFGDSDVYEAYPPADATILLRGSVLTGMDPEDPAADYEKKRSSDQVLQGVNQPMMPIAWIRELPTPAADTGSPDSVQRIFCTTMGAATDLQSEDLRRLIINAVYWGLEMPVPESADAAYIGNYEPSPYGFDGFLPNLTPEDLLPQQ